MFKKIIAIIAIITLFPIFSFSEIEWDWNVTVQGGTRHGFWPFNWTGYDKVQQEPSTKTLTCTGKGNNTCELTGVEVPGCVADHTNDMIQYADNQIKDGFLVGTYNDNYYCENQYYISTVTWSTQIDSTSNINVTNIPVQIPF